AFRHERHPQDGANAAEVQRSLYKSSPSSRDPRCCTEAETQAEPREYVSTAVLCQPAVRGRSPRAPPATPRPRKPHPDTKNLPTALTLAALAACLATGALADTVKITGASTVLDVVVKPTREAVEKNSGHSLQIIGSGTGKGLVDLVSGASDIAMVSEPMDIA